MAAILELDEHLNKNFKVRLLIPDVCLSGSLSLCVDVVHVDVCPWLKGAWGNRCLKQRRRM